MKTRQFLVTVVIPDGASIPSVKDYIINAIDSYSGGLRPEDPLFDIGDTPTRIRSLPPVNKKPQ